MAPACEGEVKMGHRVRCFFDIEIDSIPSGRVVFELFSDVCPKTCENFRALCTGEMGDGKTTANPLHYRGVKFHRVIKDFMIQAGDFSAGNGTGGESIYGGQFEDENFDLHHEEPFLLSMANKGKNTNGSQFFITTQPATHLDGKHVVFGRVVSGQEVVVTIENLPVDNRSRPLQPAVISNCGELVLQRTVKTKEKKRKKKKETVSSSESDSDVDKKKKKKKKKKEKKQKYKKNESSGEEGEVKDDGSEAGVDTGKMRSHPLVSVSIINPDEIPDVPKNRFLYRAGPENNDEEGRVDRGRDRPRSTVRAYTKSGRKVKGRGSLRYRTPSRSRSRSRSRTPPHWRQAQRRTISYEQLQKMNEEKMRREQERQTRQQERDQEIEERRRRREQRHRENEENGGKPNENSKYESHSEREQGMKGDWRDSRDRMRRDFRDGRAPQGWRNGRDRRGGEHDWREAQERTRAEEESREGRNVDWKADREDGGVNNQDLRKKLQNQRERPKSGANDVGRRMHKQSHNSERNDVKKDQEDLKSKQQDGRKKEKHDDLDETALDYEAMDNEEEEEEEDEGKKNVNGKASEMKKASHKPPPAQEGSEEVKGGAENIQTEEQEKEAESKAEITIIAEKDQSPDHKNKDYSERHKDRTKDKQRQSRDRPTRSQDTRSNRSRERRSNRSRERRNRSRDRRDRSKDRRDRSRDRGSRRDRSRERRDRSRDRRSRSRERTRDRRRHRSDSSKSSSSSSSSSRSN